MRHTESPEEKIAREIFDSLKALFGFGIKQVLGFSKHYLTAEDVYKLFRIHLGDINYLFDNNHFDRERCEPGEVEVFSRAEVVFTYLLQAIKSSYGAIEFTQTYEPIIPIFRQKVEFEVHRQVQSLTANQR